MAHPRPHLATMPLDRYKVLTAIQDAPVRLAELSPHRKWTHPRSTQARAILKQLQDENLIRRIYLNGQQRYVTADWQPSRADIRQHLDGYLRRTLDGCLEWTGGHTHRSVPVFRIPGGGNRPIHVRRWLYHDTHGIDLSAAIQLLPRCGNEDCVHPKHQTQRTASQYQRGKLVTLAQRSAIARGSRAGRGKLQWADIVTIRASQLLNKQLAERYHCSAALIGQIKRHEIWREYTATPFDGLMRPAANDPPARQRRAG